MNRQFDAVLARGVLQGSQLLGRGDAGSGQRRDLARGGTRSVSSSCRLPSSSVARMLIPVVLTPGWARDSTNLSCRTSSLTVRIGMFRVAFSARRECPKSRRLRSRRPPFRRALSQPPGHPHSASRNDPRSVNSGLRQTPTEPARRKKAGQSPPRVGYSHDADAVDPPGLLGARDSGVEHRARPAA